MSTNSSRQRFTRTWQWLGLAILAVSVFMLSRGAGWFSLRQTVVANQREVVKLVDELGGHYYYDYQLLQPNSPQERLADPNTPETRKHPLSALSGVDWWHDVFYVTFAKFDGVPNDYRVTLRSDIGDAQLAQLLQLPQLRWLALSGTGISDDLLAQLSLLPNLERLWLGRTQITDRGLQALAGCQSLTYLALEGTAMTDQGLSAISRLPALKFLSLGSPYISADGIRQLGQTTTLQELHADRLPVTDEALAALSQLSQLRVLSLRMTPLADEALPRLTGLTQLEQLYLDGTLISDAALSSAKAWTNLRQLSLAYTSITDQGLTQLANCTQLQSLDLTQSKCTLGGIRELLVGQQSRSWEEALGVVFETARDDSGALTSLDLSPLRISDTDVAALLPLSSLQWLMIPNNTLTDAGIEQLMTVPWQQLSLLRLDNAQLTDKSLQTLERLPALRTLHLANTPVSATAIERLMQSRPGLRVYTDSLEPARKQSLR